MAGKSHLLDAYREPGGLKFYFEKLFFPVTNVSFSPFYDRNVLYYLLTIPSEFLTSKFTSRISVLVLPQHLRIPLAFPAFGINIKRYTSFPFHFLQQKVQCLCLSRNSIQNKSTPSFQPRGPWYQRGSTSAFPRIAVLYFLKLFALC